MNQVANELVKLSLCVATAAFLLSVRHRRTAPGDPTPSVISVPGLCRLSHW